MELLFLVAQITLIVVLLFIIGVIAYSLLSGTPYAPIGKEKLDDMLDLLALKKNEKAIDIGAGDGRIVIAMAKKGAEATGIEINPVLVFLAKKNIKQHSVQKNARVLLHDMYRHDYTKYDALTIYATDIVLRNLEEKLLQELHPKARVVTNYFTFPNWKPKKTKNKTYLYVKE